MIEQWSNSVLTMVEQTQVNFFHFLTPQLPPPCIFCLESCFFYSDSCILVLIFCEYAKLIHRHQRFRWLGENLPFGSEFIDDLPSISKSIRFHKNYSCTDFHQQSGQRNEGKNPLLSWRICKG